MAKSNSTLNTNGRNHRTGKLVSLCSAAAAIGVDKGQLSVESKRSGFPWRHVGGEKKLIVEELIAWRNRNIRQRKPQAWRGGHPTSAAESSVGHSPEQVDPQDTRLIEIMMSKEASAIDISRAVMRLASRRVARLAQSDTLNAVEFDGLKKTLQELRQAEADYIELEQKKRQLIPLAEVEEVVAGCVGRLVRCFGALEATIATEASIWRSDPKVQEMSHDGFSRMVRDFVGRTCREIRTLESDGVEMLLNPSRQEAIEDDADV
ncbi:MAG: hypothetical protein FWD61_17745 [Phycisphaerales bacterium]|nr:hypothetical protein [Phycisphaerales bacterium]